MTMTYSLPTTGYVILHTYQRDGEPPMEATVFISGNKSIVDDITAIKHVNAECARLAQNAPSNVLHCLQLVHRPATGGQRLIYSPAAVRGAGQPIV